MDAYRRVYLDGRKPPKDLDPSTTAIRPDTGGGHPRRRNIGLRDDTVLDRYGSPHSDAMRISERIRLMSPMFSKTKSRSTIPSVTKTWGLS